MKATLTYTTEEGIVLCARYDLEVNLQLQLFCECLHALGEQQVEYSVQKWFPDLPK
jgi:hypothetical protein